MAGLTMVPAMRVESADACEAALLENIQREDLHPMDLTVAMDRVKRSKEYSLQELSVRVGKSTATCCETLSILKLPEEAKAAALECGAISRRFLVALVKLADTAEMLDAIEGYKAGTATTDSVRSQVRKQHKTTASGGKAGGFIGSLTTF